MQPLRALNQDALWNQLPHERPQRWRIVAGGGDKALIEEAGLAIDERRAVKVEHPSTRRPQHGEGYYAAFICDPDGNRIEAVTFLTADQA